MEKTPMTEGMGIGYPKAERDDIEVRGAGNKNQDHGRFRFRSFFWSSLDQSPTNQGMGKKSRHPAIPFLFALDLDIQKNREPSLAVSADIVVEKFIGPGIDGDHIGARVRDVLSRG